MRAGHPLPVYTIDNLPGVVPQTGDVIVERFAKYLEVHPNLHAAHGHDFYHLVLFTKGGGRHTIDFRHFPACRGALYFMVPGQVHSWAFEGETDGYVVNFREGYFQSLLADANYLDRFPFFSGDITEQVFQLRPDALENTASILERAAGEAAGDDLLNEDALRLLLLELFILVARETAIAGNPHSPAGQVVTLRQFRRLLNAHFRELRLPKEYAALLFVTPNYLNALCRNTLQKTAGELIRERVLLEAKRMLVNQHRDISSIAYDLGFTDNSYFSRFFRKYAGCSPETFRKEQH